MTGVTVANAQQVRDLPPGTYQVVRGNAAVRVFELERLIGKGKTTKYHVVVLRFPCDLRLEPNADTDDE